MSDDVLRLLTCAEIRAAEDRAVEHGGSLWSLMQRAGAACAGYVRQRYPRHRVIVLAGPGNNGGDALVAARLLARTHKVFVYEMAPSAPSKERLLAAQGWKRERRPLTALKRDDFFMLKDDRTPGVVLDGLFGAGLSRRLEGQARELVVNCNASGAPVVAIDVPSGVQGDTGLVNGEAIRARATLTFGWKKPAHVLQPAATFCGDVRVFDIGMLLSFADQPACENAPELWYDQLPWPRPFAHKHQRGRLGVVTGPMAATGAARLSAAAGLRVGAGLVTLMCPPDALSVVAGSVRALMTKGFDDPRHLASLVANMQAVVLGPAAGATAATRESVIAVAAAGPSLVLDADALSVFAGEAKALKDALGVDTASANHVLTPHAGEFERLFPGLAEKCSSKIEAAREAARLAGATVVFKGADTVIAHPYGRAAVNIHATPFLATAGTGDVLAGMIGGFLAQGVDMFEAACAAVWMHGDAGLRAGPGMTAEDLDHALKQSIAALYKASGPGTE